MAALCRDAATSIPGLAARAFGLIKGLDGSKFVDMNKQFPPSNLLHTAMMLVTLVWSSLAFGGEIHAAAKTGDLEKVKALLKDNPELVYSRTTNSSWNYTPLHFATHWRHKEVAELLLANKAEVNATNSAGRTPLREAIIDGGGSKDVMELLRQHGGHE